MDERQFDRLTNLVAGGATRRMTLSTLAGTVLGATLTRFGFEDVTAKRHKNKGKGKKRCLNSDSVCRADGAGKPCCSGLCCPPWILGGEKDYACASTLQEGGESGCCTEEQGGGYCCCGYSVCCGDPLRQRDTICAIVGSVCCDDTFGGSCRPGFSCCDDPAPGYCCPNTAKRGTDVDAARDSRGARVPRDFHRRDELLRAHGLVQ